MHVTHQLYDALCWRS